MVARGWLCLYIYICTCICVYACVGNNNDQRKRNHEFEREWSWLTRKGSVWERIGSRGMIQLYFSLKVAKIFQKEVITQSYLSANECPVHNSPSVDNSKYQKMTKIIIKSRDAELGMGVMSRPEHQLPRIRQNSLS